jgi:hypothetical protein
MAVASSLNIWFGVVQWCMQFLQRPSARIPSPVMIHAKISPSIILPAKPQAPSLFTPFHPFPCHCTPFSHFIPPSLGVGDGRWNSGRGRIQNWQNCEGATGALGGSPFWYTCIMVCLCRTSHRWSPWWWGVIHLLQSPTFRIQDLPFSWSYYYKQQCARCKATAIFFVLTLYLCIPSTFLKAQSGINHTHQLRIMNIIIIMNIIKKLAK